MKLTIRTIFLFLATAIAMLAADATGVWKADYQTPDGTARTSTFHLKAADGKLTGKVASQMGEVEIKDGAVKGDDISFTVIRSFNGNEMTLTYTGKVVGDDLKLKVTFNGENSFDILGKRQAS